MMMPLLSLPCRAKVHRHRPIALRLEEMEERLVPSWGSVPPATITPPSSYVSVNLNSQGDATGNASITNNEIDWYRFTATTGGSYLFEALTPSSNLDTVIATYTSSGSRVGYNDDISSSNTDSRFTITLTAGAVYFFGVTNYTGTAGGSYTWKIDGPAAPADDAYEENDTMAAAYNFGTLTADRTVTGLVMNDAADYYKFTMSAAGTTAHSVSISFTHSQGDLDMRLYNSSGTQVGSSTGSGNSETISLNGLAAGTYTIYVYGYNGAKNPNYTLSIKPAVAANDDAYEDNDTLATAYNLGTLTSTRQIANLQMRDAADWFRFTTSFTGTASHSVSISFTHSQGDLDLKLYNSSGTQIGASTGTGNSETISLNGVVAGTYYVQVYGYQGVQNPNYTLTITPPSSGGSTGNKILYLNFDGATISRTDLVRWAGSYWNPDDLDSDRNGITVQPFLRNRADRETIISQMISMVQADLTAYGMTVQRHYGLAVEGQGATTIFLGPATLTGGGYHIACDIDYGNNNPTDIAFVGDEDWGSAANTAITMADVTLHEAGHTFGLWHVASGTALESMGLRYNTPQSQWVQDTRFLDQTFNAYVSGGYAHGPGPQNSHQSMLAWSGGSGGSGGGGGGSSSNVALVDTSGRGVFRVIGSDDADLITVQRIGRYDYRLDINGQVQYLSGSTLREIRVFTNGDSRDRVVALNNLGHLRLAVDARWDGAIRGQVKVDDAISEFWRGNRHGGGCGCTACAAAAAALTQGGSRLAALAAPTGLEEMEQEQLLRYQQLGQALIVPAATRWSLGQANPEAKIVPGQSYEEWKRLVLSGTDQPARPANPVEPKVQTAGNDWSAGFSGRLELESTDQFFGRLDSRLI